MAAMKSKSLVVLMLLLLLDGMAVSAHGHAVSCKNTCPKPCTVNGVPIGVGQTKVVSVTTSLELLVTDNVGKVHSASFPCPADVTGVVVGYQKKCVYVTVSAVSNLLGILGTVLGLVLNIIFCGILL